MTTFTLEQLKAAGYEPITEPYEHHEHELLEKEIRQMEGTDFKVGEDRLKRKVICRKKGELKK